MKKHILIVFLFIPLGILAHSDMTFSINKGNVHIAYETGWTEFEIGQKMDILLELATKVASIEGYNDHIYLYFGHDYTHSYSPHMALGFEEFTYWRDYKEGFSPIATETGLVLTIYEKDIDIKQVLSLLHTAIIHVDSIKVNQYQQIIELRSTKHRFSKYDTLYSISPAQIQQYLTSPDSLVDTIISEKTFHNSRLTVSKRNIDYYYQNNKFHIYKKAEITKEESRQQGKYGEDLLVVDNILEISGESNYNFEYLVFTNDSTFYYVPKLGDEVDGPYQIDSIKAGRRPICHHFIQHYPIKIHTLVFGCYGPHYRKALFIPDSNLVISNMQKIESNLMSESNTNRSADISRKKTQNLVSLLLLFLSASLVFNVWLLVKRFKKNKGHDSEKN